MPVTFLALPYDVHFEIFRRVDMKDISSLGRACAQLRKETLSTPSLWTTVDLDGFPKCGETFVQRAGNLDLAIVYSYHRNVHRPADALQRNGEFIIRLTPRIRNLQIVLSYSQGTNVGPDGLRIPTLPLIAFSQSTPRLQSLDMYGYGPWDQPISFPPFPDSASTLQSLSLEYLHLDLRTIKPCNISFLNLSYLWPRLNHQQYIRILEHCPKLRRLELKESMTMDRSASPSDPVPNIITSQVSLPDLQVLVLGEGPFTTPLLNAIQISARLLDVHLCAYHAKLWTAGPIMDWMADFVIVSLDLSRPMPREADFDFRLTGYTSRNQRLHISSLDQIDGDVYWKLCPSFFTDSEEREESSSIFWGSIKHLRLSGVEDDFDDLVSAILQETTELVSLVVKTVDCYGDLDYKWGHHCIGELTDGLCPKLEELWISAHNAEFDEIADLLESRAEDAESDPEMVQIRKCRVQSRAGTCGSYEWENYNDPEVREEHDPEDLLRFSQVPGTDAKWEPVWSVFDPPEFPSLNVTKN